MPMPTFHVFPTPADVAKAAAERIAALADASIKERRRFSIALAGGNTPKATYELLAGQVGASIKWNRVHIWWSDERCVPWDHPDSNTRMVMETLTSKVPIDATHVHKVQTAMARPAAASAYDQELRRFHISRPLDLMLLGVGADGHTASLFPGTPAMTEPSRWVVAAQAPENAPSPERVTMTFPLMRTCPLLFIATGAEKKPVIEAIKTMKAPPLPVQTACDQSASEWFIDTAAAGQ
jgi:6-phosphogluconolactonase